MKLEELVTKVTGKAWQAQGSFSAGKLSQAYNTLKELAEILFDELSGMEPPQCESSESSQS